MARKVERKKILLVDDDEIHLTIAEMILSEKYEIVTAKSGTEAMAYFHQGKFPNLVLLDLLMPDMDGWETFNRLKAISFLQSIPIVFLTSVTEKNEEEHAREIGAADFIIKPFERDYLLKRVRKILKKYEVKK